MKVPERLKGETDEVFDARMVIHEALVRDIALGKKRFDKRIFLREGDLGRKMTPKEKRLLLDQFIEMDTAQLAQVESEAQRLKGADLELFRDLSKHRIPDLKALREYRDSISQDSEELIEASDAVEPLDAGFFTDEL